MLLGLAVSEFAEVHCSVQLESVMTPVARWNLEKDSLKSPL